MIWVVEKLCARISDARWEINMQKQPHEAGLLKLDSSKAKAELGWSPRWNLDKALNKTIEWHQSWRNAEDLASITSAQIQAYIKHE